MRNPLSKIINAANCFRAGSPLIPTLFAVVVLTLAGCATKPGPSVVVVSAKEAKAMRASGRVTTVDAALTPSAPVDDAVHLSWKAPLDSSKLPSSKVKPILVLGQGKEDGKSPRVANAIAAAGYREVHYCAEGGEL